MQEFKFKKGSHSVQHPIRLHCGVSYFECGVNFKDCAYEINPVDQADWNKLCGVGYLYHPWESIRMVWRWNPISTRIEVGLYAYHRGRRYEPEVGFELEEGALYDFVCFRVKNQNFWILANVVDDEIVDYHCYDYPATILPGYYLWPYFGGNQAAPRDLILELDFPRFVYKGRYAE